MFLSHSSEEGMQILREFESAAQKPLVESSRSLSEGGQKLKSFLENFVMESFLPQVVFHIRCSYTDSFSGLG